MVSENRVRRWKWVTKDTNTYVIRVFRRGKTWIEVACSIINWEIEKSKLNRHLFSFTFECLFTIQDVENTHNCRLRHYMTIFLYWNSASCEISWINYGETQKDMYGYYLIWVLAFFWHLLKSVWNFANDVGKWWTAYNSNSEIAFSNSM